MIQITKDKKSPMWTITKTDREGFHRQLPVSFHDMNELVEQWETELARMAST